jgi:hypothetical protein
VIKGESSAPPSATIDLPKVMINRYFISQAECALLHSLRRVVGVRGGGPAAAAHQMRPGR